MANAQTKRRLPLFPIFMLLYAVLFLFGILLCMDWFWNYIAAYEASRPETTMNAYMETIDKEYLYRQSTSSTIEIDWNLQNAAAYKEHVMQTLEGDITYAKKYKETTETQTVYMILCGKRAVGKVVLTPKETDAFGFTPWQVSSESFDFSYLMSDVSSFSITVPHDFSVYLNGIQLSSNYVTGSEIYEELKDFYDSFTLPYKVTYQAGPFLGDITVSVTDPAGNPVTIDETTDLDQFMNNCTAEESDMLKDFVQAFLPKYIDFTSNAYERPTQNYNLLLPYLVKGSALQKRMYDSVDGLQWIVDRKSSLTSLTINRCISLGEQRYLCDLSYSVKTGTFSGSMQAATNVKLIILKTDSGCQAEGMTNY